MNPKYYKIPLDFSELIDVDYEQVGSKKSSYLQLKKTPILKKSIDEHIELILTTYLGEYRYDKNYGFVIWDKEFENMEIDKFNTHNNPKQEFEHNLEKTLDKYEPRLKNVSVDILFVYRKVYRGKSIKYFVDINIKGIMLNSFEEEYHHKFQFAMGPLFK